MTTTAAVVVTYNSASTIGRCVASATRCFDHVVVVDNASCDESSEAARAAGADLVIKRSTNAGFGRATNQGIAAIPVSVDIVTILNPDVYVRSDVIDHLVRSTIELPNAGIVGPALVGVDGAIQPSARPFPSLTALIGRHVRLSRLNSRLATNGSDYIGRYECVKEPVPVPWIVGAVMVLRHDVYTRLGGFDSRFFLYGEDVDLCMRAWHAGMRVYLDPRVSLFHEYQRASRNLLNLRTAATRHHWASMLRLAWKYPRYFFMGHCDRLLTEGQSSSSSED